LPIDVRIDHARKLVVVRVHGVMSDEETFGYQRGVWSDPAVAGYDELVDMTAVEEIQLPSAARARELAALAASMDIPGPQTKMAVIAPQDEAFGLGRMFEMMREMEPGSRRKVGVFRTAEEAMAFLGHKGPIDPAAPR
jgi:hypothetical protein